jgi:hypothetical protein
MPDLGVVDVEGALKAYLKTVSALTSSPCGTRIFLGMPQGGPSKYPVIVLFRIGGGPEDADYPSDRALIQFDVWGNKGMKAECFAVTQELASTLRNTPCGTVLMTGVRLLGVSAISDSWVPDPNSGRSRYTVSCTIQTQAV